MKFSLKNNFLIMFIVFTVNTHLFAMDENAKIPPFRMPEPGTPEWLRTHDSLYGRHIAQTAVVQSSVKKPIDFSRAQTHEELKGIAESEGGFSNFSEQDKAAYRCQRDSIKQRARDVAATAAEKRAKASLSGSMMEYPTQLSTSPEPRASTPPKKNILAMSFEELRAHASSFGDRVPDDVRKELLARRNPVDQIQLPDVPKKPAGPSRFDDAVKYVREHRIKIAAIATGMVLGVDLAYAYRTKVTSEEKQNNRLPRNLLLAAGRTKTAAVLGKLKDFVQSHWAK